MKIFRLLSAVLVLALIAGCNAPAAVTTGQNPAKAIEPTVVSAAPTATRVSPTATSAVAASPTAVSTTVPTQTPTTIPAPVALGPDTYPAGINPLTGMPVKNPDNLKLPPALISVSNFPITTRPQAGLSYAPFVFEMYIGEGMTRYLAVFYGDYPDSTPKANAGFAPKDVPSVGPIRSGRLPYEGLRMMFGGFLLITNAYEGVLKELSNYNYMVAAIDDVNAIFANTTQMEKYAKDYQKALGEPLLTGLKFDTAVPAGGKPARMLWIPYSAMNQVVWKYDSTSQTFGRWQDKGDGATFVQITDRLTGEPLKFDNVIVMYAEHYAKKPTIIDIYTQFVSDGDALLFRNGQAIPIKWSSNDKPFYDKTGHLRLFKFTDAQGNVIPLKPGHTWVELVQPGTATYETVGTLDYADMFKQRTPGSGNWAVTFYPPQ